MPMGEYEDFDDCVAKNSDKENPQAYCGTIKAKVEKKSERVVYSSGTGQEVFFVKEAMPTSPPKPGHKWIQGKSGWYQVVSKHAPSRYPKETPANTPVPTKPEIKALQKKMGVPGADKAIARDLASGKTQKTPEGKIVAGGGNNAQELQNHIKKIQKALDDEDTPFDQHADLLAELDSASDELRKMLDEEKRQNDLRTKPKSERPF